MELETLKAIWKDQDLPAGEETSRDQLLALLQKKSTGPIARMRRNLRKEAILMLVSYIPCILLYWLAFDGLMSGVGWLFVVLLLFFYVYYYRKNQLLKRMLCISCEVRSNLAGQLKTLRKYLRFYFWSSTLIVPVMTSFAFGIALNSRRLEHPSINWWRVIPLLLLLVAAFTVAIYFFNRWYINKLYGRHIAKLQQLLSEMDED